MNEKRYYVDLDEAIIDSNTNREYSTWDISGVEDIADKLNELNDENEQLKQSVNNLKDTIIKITIAYQRKYDRTIVDLVDEVHDEDITDLIKELQE